MVRDRQSEVLGVKRKQVELGVQLFSQGLHLSERQAIVSTRQAIGILNEVGDTSISEILRLFEHMARLLAELCQP
jgi:hypothetical protein